jgi:hypothetical protein
MKEILEQRLQREAREMFELTDISGNIGKRVLVLKDTDGESYDFNKIDALITQTATEAYRQALEDVLAGLPGDEDLTPFDNDPLHPVRTQKFGHNTALQTIRAQIEGLLGKETGV